MTPPLQKRKKKNTLCFLLIYRYNTQYSLRIFLKWDTVRGSSLEAGLGASQDSEHKAKPVYCMQRAFMHIL